MKKYFLPCLALVGFGSSLLAQTRNVTLAWDASPDNSVIGYKIYVGGVSAGYTNSYTSPGTNLTYTVTNLTVNRTYFFAATAYNSSNVESVFSNEVGYLVPLLSQPPTISDITNRTILANYTSPQIPFIINDSDTAINLLTLSLLSSNTILINSNSFLLTGSSSNRNLYITPRTNQVGLSEITITVRDNSNNTASDKFLVTVANPVNLTYLGVKLEYGTNLSFLTTTNINIAIMTNPPVGQFYRTSLVITNQGF